MARRVQVELSPRKIGVALFAITLILTGLHLLAGLIDHWLGHEFMPFTEQFVRLFDLDSEMNIPAWFSSSLLLLSALLLLLIFFTRLRQRGPFRLHWGLLALIFIGLSIDEQAAMHECLIQPMQHLFDTSGLLFLAWVIPGALFVAAFALVFSAFTFTLPAKSRFHFILAGIIYVGGALGMELFGGQHLELYGRDNMTYELLCGLEEFLEMTGIVIFVYALINLFCQISNEPPADEETA